MSDSDDQPLAELTGRADSARMSDSDDQPLAELTGRADSARTKATLKKMFGSDYSSSEEIDNDDGNKDDKEKKSEQPVSRKRKISISSSDNSNSDAQLKTSKRKKMKKTEKKKICSESSDSSDDEHTQQKSDIRPCSSQSTSTANVKNDSDDTSDTSINSDQENKHDFKSKASVSKSEHSVDNHSKENKPVSTEVKMEVRLARLKKMVIAAGFRFNYKKMFDGLSDDKKRVAALESELLKKGLTRPFTMETCRVFKLKKEEESELAALSGNAIIGADSKTRVTRSRISTTRKDEPVEKLDLFKNLKGIISSDEDDN